MTPAKHLTESGMMGCYLNLRQLASLGMYLHGLRVIFSTGNKELFIQVLHQTVLIFALVFPSGNFRLADILTIYK